MLSYTQHYKDSQSEVPSIEHQYLLGPTESETLGQGPAICEDTSPQRESNACASQRMTSPFTFKKKTWVRFLVYNMIQWK